MLHLCVWGLGLFRRLFDVSAIKQSPRRRFGSSATTLCLSARFVKPELAEIIQPAVDVLTRALNENYSLSIDTSIRNQIVLSISV